MLKVMFAFLDSSTTSDAPAMSSTVDLLFNLLAVILPYAVCLVAVLLTMRTGERGRAAGPTGAGRPGGAAGGNSRLITAGLCLGIGVGGFIIDILLEHILQCHHMLSSRMPPVTLEAANFNMMWDGVADAMNLIMTLIGVALLVRACRRGAEMSTGVLIGAMLAGWGLFMIVEGVIDHLLFGAHHVCSGHQGLAMDLVHLMLGAVLMLIGAAIARRSRRGSYSDAASAPS